LASIFLCCLSLIVLLGDTSLWVGVLFCLFTSRSFLPIILHLSVDNVGSLFLAFIFLCFLAVLFSHRRYARAFEALPRPLQPGFFFFALSPHSWCLSTLLFHFTSSRHGSLGPHNLSCTCTASLSLFYYCLRLFLFFWPPSRLIGESDPFALRCRSFELKTPFKPPHPPHAFPPCLGFAQ